MRRESRVTLLKESDQLEWVLCTRSVPEQKKPQLNLMISTRPSLPMHAHSLKKRGSVTNYQTQIPLWLSYHLPIPNEQQVSVKGKDQIQPSLKVLTLLAHNMSRLSPRSSWLSKMTIATLVIATSQHTSYLFRRGRTPNRLIPFIEFQDLALTAWIDHSCRKEVLLIWDSQRNTKARKDLRRDLS